MDFRDVTCYLLPMNAKLQNLFERIAALPDELLGEIEQSIDEIERWRGDVFCLTDEERAAVRKGMEAARRGDFVTDEELAAFYRRHGG
jgi:predicted transcriptional regulator